MSNDSPNVTVDFDVVGEDARGIVVSVAEFDAVSTPTTLVSKLADAYRVFEPSGLCGTQTPTLCITCELPFTL